MDTLWEIVKIGLAVAALDFALVVFWSRLKAPDRLADAQLPTLAELKARAFPPTVEQSEDAPCEEVEIPDFLRQEAA